MKNKILGYTKIEPNILINNIWDNYPNIEKFINKFIEVDTHETLHKILIESLREEHELIVDLLMKEEK